MTEKRFTVEPGRWIYREGKPYIHINRSLGSYTDALGIPTHNCPTVEADELCRLICLLFNEKGWV